MRPEEEEAVCKPWREALEECSSLRRGTVDIRCQSLQVWNLLGLQEKNLSMWWSTVQGCSKGGNTFSRTLDPARASELMTELVRT